MKKHILIAGLFMSTFFAACGGAEQKNDNATDTTVTQSDTSGMPDDTLTDQGAGTDPDVGRSGPKGTKPDGGEPAGKGDGEKTGIDGGDKQ